MFKTVNSDATKLVSKIGILNRSFKDIQLDFKTLSSSGGIKNIFNIVTSKDINNLESYCKAISNGTPRLAAFNQYIQNAPTAIRKQALEFTRQKNNLDNLTRSFQQGKITQEEYNSQSAILKNQMASLQTQSLKLTIQQKALAIASRLASTAISMIANIAVGIAINGIITLISKLVNAEKELIQKNKELADSYKNNVQALENYREKYLEIIASTDSEAEKDKQLIEWKKQLVKQYGLEEEALANVNKERQTGIDLINQELYKEATKTIDELKGYEEAYKKIYNASNVINNQRGFNAMRGFEQYGIGFDAVSNRDGSFNIKITYNTNDANKQLEQLGKLLSDLKAKSLQLDKNNPLYNQFHASVNNQIEFVQKEYDRVKGIVDNYNDTVATGLAAYAQKYLYEFTTKTEGQISNVIDKASFDIWKDKLLEMAGDSDPLRQSLLELANNLFPKFTNQVEQSVEPTDDMSVSITSLNDAFAKPKELLKDIVGYANTYQSAMQKISAGTGLTADEVKEILEIDPTLVDNIIRQEDGTFTFDLGELWASYELKIVGDGKETLAEEKDKLQNEYYSSVSELNKLQAEYDQKYATRNGQYDAQYLIDLDRRIEEAKKKVQDAKINLSQVNFFESALDYTKSDLVRDSFEAVKKEIDSYNDEITDLNKTIDTLNDGNSLSYDEMTGLVNLYPQLQDKVVKTANGYTIEKSALEEVRKQSYKTRNGSIDDQIAETQTVIDETKKRIELYKHEIALISSAYAYQRAIDSGLFENLKSAEQTVNAMQDLIDTLLGYKNEVLDPDNGSGSSTKTNSLSDQLQQQIDYYKMLLEAIGIVSDKVVEGLEKEKDAIDQKIDALNDEKDALQEKNDEQQRELDLIEAKNNLDKAKKQKVFVYKEGEGLVQVQDKKAVADAQKEYDDIQKEIKIANIDKQIDVYDKQKEAIEDQIEAQQKYGEQFTNMESDIQDTLTVEQAKKALGTDEKGLLSLDDKTIAGIRDGLAEATYKKDVEDNKDNPKYQTVSLDDFLKSVGATVSPTDFQAMVGSFNTNKSIFNPNVGNILKNMQTVNNKTMNNVVNAVFNIYDATDPQNMVKYIDKYMRDLFTKTINSVK